MDSGSDAIREFFSQYARSRNTFDPERLVSQYPESWMYAGPDGVRVAAKADILASLATGKEWLRTLGHTSTTLTLMEASAVDELYVLVKATFVWRFEQLAAGAIDVPVDSTFIVYIRNGAPTIVFQHEHEDFQQALRTRGVVPVHL